MAIRPKGETIKLDDAKKLLSEIPLDKLQVTDRFIKGNHWQNRAGWVGWYPDAKSPSFAEDAYILESSFTSKNVIRGMLKRLVGAVFGKEPDWDVTRESESGQATVSTDANRKDQNLLTWWQEKKIHEVLKEFVERKASSGKACLRFYIPAGYIGDDGKVRVKSVEDALKIIYLDCPPFDAVNDAKDTNFGEKFTVIKAGTDTDTGANYFEIYYTRPNGVAVVRQLVEQGSVAIAANDFNLLELDLGGRQLVFVDGEFDEALITDSIKSQQRQVNHAKTMEGFAMRNINFPETVFLNASMEQEDKLNPKTGKLEKVLKDIWRGAGRWLNLIGISTVRADGSEQITPTDVKWRDAPDPEKFAKVGTNNARDMHEEAGMLYVFLADNPYPSGESRIEAMTDYLILLIDNKTVCDKAGQWILDTAHALAHALANESRPPLSFSFTTKLTLGRISTADRQLMLQEVQQKVRSRRNYQITAEISDNPSSEDSSILEDVAFEKKVFPEPVPASGNGNGNGNGNKPQPKGSGASA